MPTEEQFLQAERDGLLTPEEQQGINELRDMGGFPAAMGLPPKKLGKAGGPPPAPVAAPMAAAPSPAPASVTTTPQPVQGAQPQSFSDALWTSLASEGEKQRAALGGLGNALNPFGTPPPPGEEGIVPAAMNAGVNLLTAASPIISPLGTAGAVTGGTLARAGMLPKSILGMDVTPERAEMVGGIGPGLVRLIPGFIRGGARLLSPALRTAEKAAGAAKVARAGEEAALGARRMEQGMAGIGQAGQMAERGVAGEAAGGVAEDVAKRLRPAGSTPSTTQATGLLDELGNPISKTVPGVPVKTLSDKDYATYLKDLREADPRGGQAAITFDRTVTNKLGKLGPHATSEALAKDPDLLNGILTHATPTEAALIQRAVEAGKPLSKMPYTAQELEALGQQMLQGNQAPGGAGLLGALTHFGLGGAGLATFMGHTTGGLAAGGGIIAARLGLKALDLALGSRAGVAAMRGLSHLTPGAPGVAQILAGVGGRLAMPQRLEPREP